MQPSCSHTPSLGRPWVHTPALLCPREPPTGQGRRKLRAKRLKELEKEVALRHKQGSSRAPRNTAHVRLCQAEACWRTNAKKSRLAKRKAFKEGAGAGDEEACPVIYLKLSLARPLAGRRRIAGPQTQRQHTTEKQAAKTKSKRTGHVGLTPCEW